MKVNFIMGEHAQKVKHDAQRLIAKHIKQHVPVYKGASGQ